MANPTSILGFIASSTMPSHRILPLTPTSPSPLAALPPSATVGAQLLPMSESSATSRVGRTRRSVVTITGRRFTTRGETKGKGRGVSGGSPMSTQNIQDASKRMVYYRRINVSDLLRGKAVGQHLYTKSYRFFLGFCRTHRGRVQE